MKATFRNDNDNRGSSYNKPSRLILGKSYEIVKQYYSVGDLVYRVIQEDGQETLIFAHRWDVEADATDGWDMP